jgi:hypothetical protein
MKAALRDAVLAVGFDTSDRPHCVPNVILDSSRLTSLSVIGPDVSGNDLQDEQVGQNFRG